MYSQTPDFQPETDESGDPILLKKTFPLAKVKFTYHSRKGKSQDKPWPDQTQDLVTVEAPGINPLAVRSVTFTPVDYSKTGNLNVRITYMKERKD